MVARLWGLVHMKNEMSNTALIPKLRFKGFSKNWTQKYFDKSFSFHQTNTFSRSMMNDKGGKVRNIHYGDILVKYGDVIDEPSALPFVNEDIDLSKYRLDSYLQNGDVVIADTAEDSMAGKVVEIQNANEKILAGLHTMLCRPMDVSAPKFWGYYLNSPFFHNTIVSLLTGTKVLSISKSNISKTTVAIPEYQEQQIIADCLFFLDKLITAESKKLEELKMHKRGLLQKMFPAEGKTVPEVRFPGFTDAWEQRKLGGIFTFQYGEGNKNPSDGGEYPVYGAGGQQGFYSKYNAENSIIIGHMGDAGCVTWGEGKHFVTYNGTITTAATSDFPIRFGYYLLLTTDLRKLTGGSSLKFLTYDMVREIETFIPAAMGEQKQIGMFFASLDRIITLHRRKVESLRMHKKGLMQGLFPPIAGGSK